MMMMMCTDAFADDIISNAPCSRTHRLLSTAENKRESVPVPQSDAGVFSMMSSAKASGFMYKTSFSFIT